MDKEQLISLLNSWQEGLETEENNEFPIIRVPVDSAWDFCNKLKESNDTSFDYLFCLTGVDYKEHLEVVYHLESTKLGHKLVVKVATEGRENPAVDSVYNIWPTAEWHEREAYDLFGIIFNGHPDLRRILLPDDWEGYPMRKDYVDEVNMIKL